jgi:hypothetical protein
MSTARSMALLALLLVAGCATGRQVSDFKELGATGDYRAIATQEVQCDAGERGCEQLHLIKGDACYRLARQGEAGYYDCAIRELSTGLDEVEGTAIAAGSTGPYWENLMEALRQRRDLAGSRAESAPLTAALDQRAAQFILLFPGEPAGPYYSTSAGLAAILDQPGGPTGASCSELVALQRRLAPAAARPGRYTASIDRLDSDITATLTRIASCPS